MTGDRCVKSRIQPINVSRLAVALPAVSVTKVGVSRLTGRSSGYSSQLRYRVLSGFGTSGSLLNLRLGTTAYGFLSSSTFPAWMAFRCLPCSSGFLPPPLSAYTVLQHHRPLDFLWFSFKAALLVGASEHHCSPTCRGYGESTGARYYHIAPKG